MANKLLVHVLLGCLFMVMYTEGSSRRPRGVSEYWDYTTKYGPETWGGVCKTGKNQSPINIVLKNAIPKDFPPFNFDENYLRKVKFTAKNNGHSIYVTAPDVRPVVYGGGLGGKFIFEQLHLHWESEHEFDGKRADLEMHMVHYNSKYGTISEAIDHPDGIAVLAVIFDEASEGDPLMEEFFHSILNASAVPAAFLHPPLPDNSIVNTPESISLYFSLRELLPRSLSSFFRYDGSLTTPGCYEVVQWTIFTNRLRVSRSVLEEFRKLLDHHGNELLQNFRPPQDLNGREVYIQNNNNFNLIDDGRNGVNRKALTSILPVLIITIVVFKPLFILNFTPFTL